TPVAAREVRLSQAASPGVRVHSPRASGHRFRRACSKSFQPSDGTVRELTADFHRFGHAHVMPVLVRRRMSITTSPDNVAQAGGSLYGPRVAASVRGWTRKAGGPGPSLASRLRHAKEVETNGGSKGLRFLATRVSCEKAELPGRYEKGL